MHIFNGWLIFAVGRHKVRSLSCRLSDRTSASHTKRAVISSETGYLMQYSPKKVQRRQADRYIQALLFS